MTDKDCYKPLAWSLLNLSGFILPFTIVNGDILGNYINIQLAFNFTKSSALTAFFATSFNIYLLCTTIYFFLSILNLPPFNFVKVPIFFCYETGRTDAPDLPLLYCLLFCIFLSHSLTCLFYPSVFNFCYEFLHCSIHCIPEDEKWNNFKILKSDKMAEAYKKNKITDFYGFFLNLFSETKDRKYY